MGDGAHLWDGRLSIEHQLDIHVNDLLQFGSQGEEVREILTGLQYVLDYRIRGHKSCVLDEALCERLVRTLLLFTGERDGGRHLLGRREQRLTANAEYAFALLADFCSLVSGCAEALRRLSPELLRSRLCLYWRICRPVDEGVLVAAISILRTLTVKRKEEEEAKGDTNSSTRRRMHYEWQEYIPDSKVEAVTEIVQLTNFFSEGEPPMPVSPLQVNLHPPPSLYFDRDPQRVLHMFGTDEEHGLPSASSSEVAQDRLHELTAYYGHNVIPSAKERSLGNMLLAQFGDLMVIILIITSIVSAIVDYPQLESAIVLGIVVLLNVLVGLWQEVRSTRTIAAMKSLQIPNAHVRRSGREEMIPSTELVPGDIVLLGEGDYVPADLRLIRTSRLEVQESILTGEPISVPKHAKAITGSSRKLPIPRCRGNTFMGTMVTRGTAVGVVVRTGAHTEIGMIGAALSQEEGTIFVTGRNLSHLRDRLARLSKVLILTAIILCLIVALLGVWRGEEPVAMVRLAISLAVSVIPEGLVAILTAAIALAIHRLAKQNALARRMNVVEALGAVSVAAADKTGTLTEGRMRLELLWVPSVNRQDGANAQVMTEAQALAAAAICNNATMEGVGEPTDSALIRGAIVRGWSPEGVIKRILEIPFDSERRMMSVVVRAGSDDDNDGTMAVYSKGAAEVIIPKCTHYLVDCPKGQAKGEEMELDEAILRSISLAVDKYADAGLRVIALARRTGGLPVDLIDRATTAAAATEENTSEAFDQCALDLEQGMTFLGLACLLDPPREGVATSVALCQQAGLSVIMITGDHLKTATAIARQVGIFDPNSPERARSIHGRDLDLLTVETLASLRPFPSVFARVSPQHKLMIVQALQRRGESVAMTGDGVNDAPAIREAHVGVAMGRSGAEITREAASLLLLDDNFSVLVGAIAQGRQMFRNIRLFLIYLLSCNSAEIWTVLGALLFSGHSPFTPLNILWANIIADVPPSMCLALEEEPLAVLMRERPAEVVAQVLGYETWILIGVNGFILAGYTLLGFLNISFGLRSFEFVTKAGPQFLPLLPHTKAATDVQRRSEAFLILVGLQMVLALFSRSATLSTFSMGFLGNVWLLLAVCLSLALLVAGLYVPWLATALELAPVGPHAWTRFAIGIFVLFLANELTKLILRRAAAARKSPSICNGSTV